MAGSQQLVLRGLLDSWHQVPLLSTRLRPQPVRDRTGSRCKRRPTVYEKKRTCSVPATHLVQVCGAASRRACLAQTVCLHVPLCPRH